MLYKNIDNTKVECSSEEEIEILAEWAENNRPRTAEEIEAALILESDIEVKFSEPLRAFALVLLSEINILRVKAGLPERAVQQLKDAIKAKL